MSVDRAHFVSRRQKISLFGNFRDALNREAAPKNLLFLNDRDKPPYHSGDRRRPFTAKTRRIEGLRFSEQFGSETTRPEGSATRNLRDLGVLCGETNTCPPDTEFSTGRVVVLHHREHGGHGGVRRPRTARGRPAGPIKTLFLVYEITPFRASAAAVARDESKRHSRRSFVPSRLRGTVLKPVSRGGASGAGRDYPDCRDEPRRRRTRRRRRRTQKLQTAILKMALANSRFEEVTPSRFSSLASSR